MHELTPLIYDLAIMLGVAGIVVLLFQRIHQPIVLGYLVAGMIIGPYTPPHGLVNDIPNIKTLSELGVIFLMFALGLEFSFQKLTRVGFSASVTGTIEVILMMVIGYSAGLLMHWPYYDSLFLGAALSISSTTIIIKAIDDLGLKTKRFAELIFGVLIVEDLLAILLLVALSTIVITKNFSYASMLAATIKLILVVGGWFLIGYFMMPPLFRKMANYINQETLTIISVALCLFLVCIAASFHYSTALGAFIMGSILAETSLIHRIENLIHPIRDIFAAVFFISVGMLIDPAVIFSHWQAILLLSSVTIIGKMLTTTIATTLSGQSIYTSIRVGFSMAQIGEFSFIIAALGLSLNVTSHNLYPIIVAVSGITTFTTPYLIKLSGHLSQTLEKKLPTRLQYFLQSYAAWAYRTQTFSQRNPRLRTTLIRLLMNAIIVAIIFTLIHQLLYPFLQLTISIPWLTNTLCLLSALIISSPFVWGMVFSFRSINLPSYAKTYLNPAIFVIWLITLAEISILSLAYFRTWGTVSFFLSIVILFFIFSYKHLGKSYRWFEEQLINNIKVDDEKEKEQYKELAPWDTHLVEIKVGELSPFAGKTLQACQIREKFGINIVAICHGSRVIPAPRGSEKIISHDTLIVLGNDEQIDTFRNKVESISHEKSLHRILDNFILQGFLLEKTHPLIGKTIRDSKIREEVHGLVVGLERDNVRTLNPSPDTVLQEDDLLLIVGETKNMQKLDSNP